MMSVTDDYYTILAIAEPASISEIKKSYRKLALRWHPEKNPSNRQEAEKRFNELSEAYQVLSNPNWREQYDKRKDDEENGETSPTFTFRDPREVFREFFGGRDPFSEPIGALDSSLPLETASPPQSSDSRGPEDGGSPSSSPTATGSIRSVSTSTRISNGKRIVTRKLIENGMETVTVEEDGAIKIKTINGVMCDPLSETAER